MEAIEEWNYDHKPRICKEKLITCNGSNKKYSTRYMYIFLSRSLSLDAYAGFITYLFVYFCNNH